MHVFCPLLTVQTRHSDFDIAWKVMKDILIQHYAITNFVSGSPREVLRTSFQADLIADDVWLEMLKVRNELSHDYDGEIVLQHCQTIIHTYVDMLSAFQKKAEEILE